jgi:hypothetical protein
MDAILDAKALELAQATSQVEAEQKLLDDLGKNI